MDLDHSIIGLMEEDNFFKILDTKLSRFVLNLYKVYIFFTEIYKFFAKHFKINSCNNMGKLHLFQFYRPKYWHFQHLLAHFQI